MSNHYWLLAQHTLCYGLFSSHIDSSSIIISNGRESEHCKADSFELVACGLLVRFSLRLLIAFTCEIRGAFCTDQSRSRTTAHKNYDGMTSTDDQSTIYNAGWSKLVVVSHDEAQRALCPWGLSLPLFCLLILFHTLVAAQDPLQL